MTIRPAHKFQVRRWQGARGELAAFRWRVRASSILTTRRTAPYPQDSGWMHMKRKIHNFALGLGTVRTASNLSAATTNETERAISADFKETNGPLNTMCKRCVGAGRANEALRADWQRQLTIAHRECGFEYIRMYGLFTDDMDV